MKTIYKNLPSDLTEIEICLFADEHIGDAQSNLDRVLARIEYVKNTPNAYCILNGDIIDFATKMSIGDVETRTLNIMAQLEKAIEIFAPIKDKIIAITSGNHEGRGYRNEGFDISKTIAMQLGLLDIYAPATAYIFLSLGSSVGMNNGKPIYYTIFATHGGGGGRKEGAKIIRLADLANIVDADIYIHSHTHLPMVMKNGYYRANHNHKLNQVTRLFVNTASNLDYGGYGEVANFKPNTTDTPTIYLSGTKKEAKATL